ncbi:2-amino-4-hydroxy-6-hydroxymethyldihydropteridine diphosphokinase [Weeksellaceae bacterium A-14]|uniref:2-amino-4-hydroxy-6- hydroxymethyldihydropteridine diphosphokinase n=1 Tax=Daejeonia sp. YH14 TaxID=3439042 RepID=UPI0031E49D51
MSQIKVILLLGSNIGDTKKNIDDAIGFLEDSIGEITAQSKILYTRPVEFVSCNIFCNIALSINTHFSPIVLLKKIKNIEKLMGRALDSGFYREYRDRIIDIDIVRYGNLNFSSKSLEVPHKKHIEERAFSKELLNSLKISEKHRL